MAVILIVCLIIIIAPPFAECRWLGNVLLLIICTHVNVLLAPKNTMKFRKSTVPTKPGTHEAWGMNVLATPAPKLYPTTFFRLRWFSTVECQYETNVYAG